MTEQTHTSRYFVDDLQAVEPEALSDVDGITVTVEVEADEMGFPRVRVEGPTAEAVLDYIRAEWGTDDPDWFNEHVAGRCVACADDVVGPLSEENAADPLGLPEGVTSAGTKVEDDPKQDLLDLVEDEWYKRTKGDLYLTAEDDGEQDAALAAFVLKMAAEVDEFVSTVDAEQNDESGNEILDRPLPRREVARRIAAAIDLLSYGGQA